MGEAPGRDEDRLGRPFVGATGQEFDRTYLPLAGLDRAEVYVTNTRLCRPDLNRKPTDREARDCAQHHLPQELAEVCPEVVVLMGGTACGLVTADGGIDLEVEHGIPRWCENLFGWAGWVVPMYHPALGLHDTSKMTYILEDWANLQGRSEAIPHVQARDYRLAQSPHELDEYLRNHHDGPIGMDTETHDGRLWSVQVSVRVGTARMVLADNQAVMHELELALCSALGFGGGVLVFHNAMADLPVVEGLVGWIPALRWRDTMAEAWHLGNLPQGLKALSYRLLGRRRPGWEEVVGPASREKVGDWLMRALEVVEGMGIIEERTSAKTGRRLKPRRVPNVLVRPIKSVLMNMVKSTEYDVWAKVRERMGGSGTMGVLEGLLGPIPAKGIAHVPLEQAVQYGCSDADDTLALAVELERLRGGVVEVADGDVDVGER